MATKEQGTRQKRRLATQARLERALKRERLTLADVRRLLLPADPWEAVRGLWANRRTRAERAQRKLRADWDRST